MELLEQARFKAPGLEHEPAPKGTGGKLIGIPVLIMAVIIAAACVCMAAFFWLAGFFFFSAGGNLVQAQMAVCLGGETATSQPARTRQRSLAKFPRAPGEHC